MVEPLIVPLTQFPAGGLWAGFNGFYGSANIPTNIFLSHIIIRNTNIQLGALDTVTWTFPNCFIYFKRRPELDNELLYSGEVSNTHQFVPAAATDSIRYGGTRINISQPIPYESIEPKIFISMEETAANVTYTPLVMEIHYSGYRHPVSQSSDLVRLGTKINDKIEEQSNGLRFNDIIYLTDEVTTDATILTVPAGYLYEVTLFTMYNGVAAVWGLYRNGGGAAIIRHTTGLEVAIRNDIWLKATETLDLVEHTGTTNCSYTAHIKKWEIL